MNKKLFKSTIILSIIAAALSMGVSDCSNESKQTTATQIQANNTKVLMNEAQRQVGMPNIKNFQQRKLMKLIQELCDQSNLMTYTYIKNEMTGKLVFIGKSVGFGVPFSAQFTNPLRIVDTEVEGGVRSKYNDNGEVQILPQPDPNGLFMPTSSSATWIMLINPKTNKPEPVYIESDITVSTFELEFGVE